MSARTALRAVPETGEIPDDAPSYGTLVEEIGHQADVIAGLQRDIRGWAARYANLARDVERQAREHPMWGEVSGLFDLWRKECGHPRSRLNAERFWLAEPYVRKDGAEMCRRAIRGAAFDPFITRRKNGSQKRHDDWDLVFRNRGKFEEFACRAPRVGVEPDQLHKLATAILAEMPEDDRSSDDRIMDAIGRAQAELRRNAT